MDMNINKSCVRDKEFIFCRKKIVVRHRNNAKNERKGFRPDKQLIIELEMKEN